MSVTRTEINTAQEVIGVLVGDKAEAEAYARDPEGWLDGHGYAEVSAEALATSAAAYTTTAAPPVSAGAVAQLDSIVYTILSLTRNVNVRAPLLPKRWRHSQIGLAGGRGRCCGASV